MRPDTLHLTNDEILALSPLERYHQFVHIVPPMAAKYARDNQSWYDDLLSVGNIGLWKHCEMYNKDSEQDPDGNRFAKTAVCIVKHAIIDEMRRQGHLSRSTVKINQKLYYAKLELCAELKRQPNIREMFERAYPNAEKRSWAQEKYRYTSQHKKSLEDTMGEVLHLASEEEAPNAQTSGTDLLRHVRICLDKMPQGQKDLLRMYYFEDMTCKAIARLSQCSGQAIRNRLEKAHVAFREAVEFAENFGTNNLWKRFCA